MENENEKERWGKEKRAEWQKLATQLPAHKRKKIITLMMGGEHNTGQIAEEVNVSLSVVAEVIIATMDDMGC